MVACVPRGLYRFQQSRVLHFLTFSCYRRRQLLRTRQARDLFEQVLERARRSYGFYVLGYVVMPEHVHLLVTEPERARLSTAIQMLKQMVSQKLPRQDGSAFWQPRYYDFNVWSTAKRVEKLKYIHRNPVKRGLATRPEDWEWSSYRHYAEHRGGTVEIASPWNEWRKRPNTPTLSPTEGEKGGAPTLV